MAEVQKPADTSSAAYAAGRDAHAAGASLSEGMEQYSNLGVVTDAADERDFTAGWNAEAAALTADIVASAPSLDAQIAAKMRSHAAAAAAEHTEQELEGAVEAARLWMRDHTGHDGDAVKALHLCLTETEKATNGAGASKKIRGLLCYAFLQIQDEQEDTGKELEEAERLGTIATKLLALSDIAERECSAQQLEAARQEMREWMREHGVGKPLEALAIRLREPGPSTVTKRGLVVHAAKAILEEGTADRGSVPTQDAPSGDTGSRGKGKKVKGAAKATGPKKSKRSTSWVGRLGTTVTCYRTKFGVDDSRLLEMLVAGAFDRTPETVMSEPVYGFCPIDDPSLGTGNLTALPTIGSDPEYVVWGLRRDAKTGCPTHRFRYEAEREATGEALAAGKTNASGGRIKELTDAKVTAWYRTATPQTTVFPLTWHRPTWTLQVHTDNAEAVQRAAAIVGRTLGAIERVPGRLEQATADDLAKISRTDIRRSDPEQPGSADLGVEALLWLVGRQMGGTGVVTLEGGARLEWWLDEAIELIRSTADEKKLLVKLGGAPAEGGSLATALADGAVMRSARFGLRLDGDRTWKVTLSGVAAKSWKLPTLTKPDGTPAGLDAAVDERLRLWAQGSKLLDTLLTDFLGDRFDRGSWRQRMSSVQRLVIKDLDGTRAKFIASTGQVAMFAEQVAEHVEGQNAEKPKGKGSRGRAARDAAAADAAGA